MSRSVILLLVASGAICIAVFVLMGRGPEHAELNSPASPSVSGNVEEPSITPASVEGDRRQMESSSQGLTSDVAPVGEALKDPLDITVDKSFSELQAEYLQLYPQEVQAQLAVGEVEFKPYTEPGQRLGYDLTSKDPDVLYAGHGTPEGVYRVKLTRESCPELFKLIDDMNAAQEREAAGKER